MPQRSKMAARSRMRLHEVQPVAVNLYYRDRWKADADVSGKKLEGGAAAVPQGMAEGRFIGSYVRWRAAQGRQRRASSAHRAISEAIAFAEAEKATKPSDGLLLVYIVGIDPS